MSDIDSLELVLDEAAVRNFVQFPVLGEYVWPNPVVLDSWSGEVQRLRNWVLNRAAWIDGAMDDFESVSSTEVPENIGSFEVRPNPGSGRFWFVADEFPDGARAELRIYNTLGQMIQTKRAVESGLFWDADLVPAGPYHYRVELEGKVYSGILVVR